MTGEKKYFVLSEGDQVNQVSEYRYGKQQYLYFTVQSKSRSHVMKMIDNMMKATAVPAQNRGDSGG